MNDSVKVSPFYVYLLTITSVGLLNHVIIIPALMESSKRDAWLAVMLALCVFFLYAAILAFIAARIRQRHLYDWLAERLGKTGAGLVCLLIVLYFLIASAVTLNDMTIWTKVTYLVFTPKLLIVLIFTCICTMMALTDIRTIVIVNGILLPVIIALGFFVAFANVPDKDYGNLLPMLEHGLPPIITGAVYSGAGLSETLIVILLLHRMKGTVKYRHLVFTGLILAGLTLGPIMGSIAVFGPEEAIRQRHPAYELWGMVTLGRFVEHLDFFSIYQWLSGALIRISLGLYILIETYPLEAKSKKARSIIGWSAGLLIIAATMLPVSDMTFLRLLSKALLPLSLGLLAGIAVLVWMLSLWSEYRQGGNVA